MRTADRWLIPGAVEIKLREVPPFGDQVQKGTLLVDFVYRVIDHRVPRTFNPMAVTKVSRLTEVCAFFRMFHRWAPRFLVFTRKVAKNVFRHDA